MVASITKTFFVLGVVLHNSSIVLGQDNPFSDGWMDGPAAVESSEDDSGGRGAARTVGAPLNSGTSAMRGVFGDPHFLTWSGESFDFHGVCDLVLLKNTEFEGVGMHIHVRSKKIHERFSYVDSASVQIGDDTLEVKGGKKGEYWINGKQGDDTDNDGEVAVLSGKYPVVISRINEKSKQVKIGLGGDDEAIKITTWNAMVRVSISGASRKHFGTSVGMMGAFSTGEKLGRDGVTTINDTDEFGQEWQVLPSESKLFHEYDGDIVKAPSRCQIPSKSDMRRRLDESLLTVEEAKIACSRINPDEFDLCVFDVMASNDKNLAGAY